jgi:hypothetical protein
MSKKHTTKHVIKTPTTELLILWQKGFFTEWRSAAEVSTEFAKAGCHFLSTGVSKALSRAKFITPKGKGKGLLYIQSYPYEE